MLLVKLSICIPEYDLQACLIENFIYTCLSYRRF